MSMKAPTKGHSRWSPQEEELIREFGATSSDEELASLMEGRTAKGVSQKRLKMGVMRTPAASIKQSETMLRGMVYEYLKRNKPHYEIHKLTGVSLQNIRRWAEHFIREGIIIQK